MGLAPLSITHCRPRVSCAGCDFRTPRRAPNVVRGFRGTGTAVLRRALRHPSKHDPLRLLDADSSAWQLGPDHSIPSPALGERRGERAAQSRRHAAADYMLYFSYGRERREEARKRARAPTSSTRPPTPFHWLDTTFEFLHRKALWIAAGRYLGAPRRRGVHPRRRDRPC